MKFSVLIGIALWALIPGFIAKKKYRSFWGFYFLSFLISPLITMIIALCVSDKICEYYAENPLPYRPTPERQEVSAPSNIPVADNRVLFCRKCGEKLLADGQFCHKCGAKTEIVCQESDHTPLAVSTEPKTIWICQKCGTKNLSTRNDCWSCGSVK